MQYGEEQDFELFPEGIYNCLLDDATLDMTSNPPVLTCKFKAISTNEKISGKLFWQRFRFADNCMKFNSWQLGVMGVWSQLKGAESDFDAAKLAADAIFTLVKSKQSFLLKMEHNEYNGKTYENVLVQELTDNEYVNLQEPTFGADTGGPASIDSGEEIPF